MNKPLFACDIDNTLIYSRKHPHGGWPCVEWIHGVEQAYMTPATAALLPLALSLTRLIPVTSRSIEQYRRLRLPGNIPAAVTANGADLLLDGEPDAPWREETRRMIAPWRGELSRSLEALSPCPHYIRCRMVDDAYLFVYCREGVDPRAEGERLCALTSLRVMASGKKLYLLPPPLDKGTAVRRLLERFGSGRCICAGDSEMDLPMLIQADVAIVPARLAGTLSEGAHICPEDRVFSEFALQTAVSLARGNDEG